MNTKDFCFCTLAVGDRYRTHAHLLAQDIQQHMPDATLCLLSDQPQEFNEFPQVMAFEHHLQSVKGYHDKRFILAKSLSLFENCIFVDADVRVLGSIVQDLNVYPGITARAGTNLSKHIGNMKNRQEISIIEQALQKLNLDQKKVKWLHEFMFVMKRQNGLQDEFFRLWQTIAYFFEMQGLYHGEGYAMGLAAARIGININFFEEDCFPFFKDNIELLRIRGGLSNLQDKQKYFDIQKKIEYPQRSFWQKVINKLSKQAIFCYRLLRLRFFVRQDPQFKQLFGSASENSLSLARSSISKIAE
jgi:hypothetical protein